MYGFVATYHRPGFALQAPCEAAVVIPSILRPSLGETLRSVFAQRFDGRIHVLVGIDRAGDDAKGARASLDIGMIEAACDAIPENVVVTVFYPGYSTARRHGGLCEAADGGALRTILTHLANSDHVAYLDDDNTWRDDHLATLCGALDGGDYAWSLRWFVDHRTGRPLAIDRWESVGPDRGLFRERFGGFVDPNTLMLHRGRCREAVVAWTTPIAGDPTGLTADREVFARLRRLRGVPTGEPSAFYRLDPRDPLFPMRMRLMGLADEA